jgi:hypothetical protein
MGTASSLGADAATGCGRDYFGAYRAAMMPDS